MRVSPLSPILDTLDGADHSSLGEIVNEIKAVKDNKSLLVVKAEKGKGKLKKDHWTAVVGHEGGDKDDTRVQFWDPQQKEPFWVDFDDFADKSDSLSKIGNERVSA
ncbi:uncharacterized protein L199_005248 [Kwoniella botswanensis]|uniref:uncharacterized protein n=1 Tax=Kwoniella botswanensis TaxID=1268659 RepID=UPI00315DA1F6